MSIIFDECADSASCEKIVIVSHFDESAVDFLDDLNVLGYKVTSFDAVHLPLISLTHTT